jgi:2-methylcitrate dehydratase PrpD
MTGPASVFEGRFGVFRSFARTEVPADGVDAPTDDSWQVEMMGSKPYPACLCVHPQVQAVLELRARGVVGPGHIDDLVEIICEVPQMYVPLVYEPRQNKVRVRSAYEGRFSAPYCMGCALVDGFLNPSSFDAAHREDPRVRAVAERVTWRVADLPEFPTSFPARVRVLLRNGETHEAIVRHNLGSPGNPMDESKIGAKFLACTAPIVGDTKARQLQQALRALPAGTDLQPFFKTLREATARGISWT